MKFLKLTASGSEKAVRINFANVNSYSPLKDGDGSIIYFNWGTMTSRENKPTMQYVIETPEEIDKMLGLVDTSTDDREIVVY